MEELLSQLAVVSATAEALVEVFKPFFDLKNAKPEHFIVPLVGVALCVLGNVDLYQVVGLPLSMPYVGSVLTGLVGGRVAVGLHEGIKLLQAKRQQVQES